MTERLSLFDLSQRTGVVKHGDVETEIHGLTIRAILGMMGRWDEVQKFFVGLTIGPAEALKASPDVAATIIANGMTPVGATTEEIKAAEAAANKLPASLALAVMIGVWNSTFTEGFGPFMEAATAIAEAASVQDPGKGAAMASRRRSRASTPNTDPTPATPGTKPQGNSRHGPSSPAGGNSAEPAT